MRRTWVDVADVVLGAALLVVAVLAGTESRLATAAVAVVLGLAWGARGVVGLRRGVAAAVVAAVPDPPAGPLPATR